MAKKQTCTQIRKLIIKDIQDGFSQRKVATKFKDPSAKTVIKISRDWFCCR